MTKKTDKQRKAPLNYLPASSLRAVAGAMQWGNEVSYEPWNWLELSKDDIPEILAAILRHVTDTADPTESNYAHDSKCHHLAHAAAGCLIALKILEEDYTPISAPKPDEKVTDGAVADIVGKWPGDESDEELEAFFSSQKGPRVPRR